MVLPSLIHCIATNQDGPSCYSVGFGVGRADGIQAVNQRLWRNSIDGRAYYEGFLSGCISGQGKDYFSCQKMTNAPANGDGGVGGGFGGSSGNGGGGGGGFGGGGGGGH